MASLSPYRPLAKNVYKQKNLSFIFCSVVRQNIEIVLQIDSFDVIAKGLF